MKVVLSHSTGNSNVRAALEGMYAADMLYQFHTTIATFENSLIEKICPYRFLAELRRRHYKKELASRTKIHPWREVGRIVFSKAGFSRLVQHEKGIFCIDAVNTQLDKKVAWTLNKESNEKPNAIYAYEDSALQSFKIAKTKRISCLYDLPIGYWRYGRKILLKEQEIWPEWKTTLTGFKDSSEKLMRKDNEINLADIIFVASSFTAKTLKDYPGKLPSIKVLPYGFPPIFNNRIYPLLRSRKLKILFVGSLSQRKGIANLITSVQSMRKFIELTIVGNKVTQDCLPLNAAILNYNWFPSLPHGRVLQLMREHDVLVFPSLFEGFGLVITEAMSQGTPVITTERTAGPDFIKSGKNGWIVEAGSTEDLQKAIEEILFNPNCISEIGFEAMKVASQRPWQVYGKELAESIWKIMLTKIDN